MKRNYCLLRIAFVWAIGFAFLLPGSARAQDDVIVGTYTGFSHSSASGAGDSANLIIQTETNTAWTGLFTLYGNIYAVTGKVDANGILKFNSPTGLTGRGTWQDLTRGGALILATYKLSSGDQGEVNLLRHFSPPPAGKVPPDIAGSWGGPFENILSLISGTVEWLVQQDRTPTGAPGTGFTVQQTIEAIVYDFVGTIDAQGNFVIIGLSARGLITGGGKVESDELDVITVGSLQPGQPGDGFLHLSPLKRKA